MTGPRSAEAARRRPLWLDMSLLFGAALVFAAMVALGVWQMQRLTWKLELIDRVESRAFGPAQPLPRGDFAPDEIEYLRVSAEGQFEHARARQVKAVTELGPGFWLMTPLGLKEGGTLWVNRGFVPAGTGPEDWTAPEGPVALTGLVRLTEEGGTLLERNRPEANRWVSRDVAALSQEAGLSGALPYFVDADHLGAPEAWPRGGLTQLVFRNTHLSYALTWFAMAALFFGAMVYVIWERRKAHRPG